MSRCLSAVPLLGALMLLSPGEASAQLRRPLPPPIRQDMSLAGMYENITSGGTAFVVARRGGYIFINEHGSEAFFAWAGPGRLEMLQGEWDRTTARPQRDRFGRTLIRFDSNGPPGFWLRVR